MKTAVFITMRPNRGATGGPAGVLYVIREVLGHRVGNIRCHYLFQPIVKRSFKGKRGLINRRLFQLYFLLHPRAYYVTHDIHTASMLAKMHRNYSLIYHHQGPFVYERLHLGTIFSDEQMAYWRKIEQIAFLNAYSVHFPSNGAENMYFSNDFASCKREEVRVGEPLYNTITYEKPTEIVGLEPTPEKLTLFSLGTITFDKGQDRVIPLIESYIQQSNKKVRYIMVGWGPLKDDIVRRCRELETKFNNFEFVFFERLRHSEVMYIHSITDVYIMMHRVSIFDFSTLEAMQSGSAVALSSEGGNLEFNKDENILFVDDTSDARKLLTADVELYKKKNQQVFNKYFSAEAFRTAYTKLLYRYFNIN